MKKQINIWVITFFLAFSLHLTMSAQERIDILSQPSLRFLTLKTNLLYDATATFNLGLEFRLNKKLSLDIPVNYNPFTFSNGMKWRHVMVQPELRLWLSETFRGHFFGVHGHYAFYNVANLPDGPFTAYMNSHRFQGWLVGAGLSYGYQWQLGKGWGMEATIGAGYAYRDYDKFHRLDTKTKIGESKRHYIGIDKVGLSLTYTFGGRKKAKASDSKAVEYTTPLPVVEEEPKETVDALIEVVDKLVDVVDKLVTIEPKEVKPKASHQLDDTVVQPQTKKGKAFIDYRSGQVSIDPNYGNNGQELQKISEQIEEITNHPRRTVTHVIITSYASPEGTFHDNLRLTEKRAEAMKQHIRSILPLPNTYFTIVAAGEDWDELERLVSESDMDHKDQILRVIRETNVLDGRETILMQLLNGEPYQQMKDSFFSHLRRTEYQIEYIETSLQ